MNTKNSNENKHKTFELMKLKHKTERLLPILGADEVIEEIDELQTIFKHVTERLL